MMKKKNKSDGHEEIDVTKLGLLQKKLLLDCVLNNVEQDHDMFLRRLRDRMDKQFLVVLLLHFHILSLLHSVGMMTVALTPNHQIAAIVMSFFLSFWNLFSGFLLPRMQIPIRWRWYYWASPVAWTIYGLVTSQVGDKESLVEIPGGGKPISVKAYLDIQMGFKYDFLPQVALVHIAFVVIFLLVCAYGIRFLNFQKR